MPDITSDSPTSRIKKPYRPWIVNIVWCGYGVILLWMDWHFYLSKEVTNAALVGAAAAILLIVWSWRTLMARTFGQRLERKSIKALRKATFWKRGVEVEEGRMLRSGADVDAIVKNKHGRIFNVEIKSMARVKKSKQFAAQAANAAAEIGSTPIVWFPRAKVIEVTNCHGVLMVGGDAARFVKEIDRMDN